MNYQMKTRSDNNSGRRFRLLMPSLLSIIGLAAGLPASSFSQVYTPPAPKANTSSGSSGGTSNNTTIINKSGQKQGSNQVLGNDVPFLDPTTEVFSFDGKTFNVNDNRIFRSRFEKYLSAAEASSEMDQAYRKAIRDILDTLSPHNRNKSKLPEAVAMLQHAAQFPQDAHLCESLANAVYRVYLARKSSAQLKALNVELDRQRRKLDWNFDQWKDGPALNDRRKLSEDADKKKQQKASDPVNAGHIQRYVTRIAETEAQRVANKAKMALTDTQAKLEFQALVVQFFLQRRFEHVVMGARFYTEFFKDDSGRLEFKEGSEMEKNFSETIGFDPTTTTLETFANEALRDVAQSVESFYTLLGQGRIDGAARQLQQAFVMGENLPVVQSVPRAKKEQILDYTQNSFQLVNAIEVKDYGLAEDLVNKMKTQASDFDYSKPMAAIGAAKLSGNMRLRTARNAALKGDNDAYEKNITAAAQIWPSNPALKEQFNMLADASDVQQQAKLEFDRLLGTQSYRQIFTNKARFIAATVEDPERQKALNQIVNNILEIETVLKQADTLKKSGNPYAAWEIVEKTFKKFPDDVPLSARRSDLSTDVADFVKALKKAENLEARDQRGSSLTWFLSARKIYPQSEYAAEGIKRLADAILPEDSSSSGNPATQTETDGNPPSPGDASASL